MKTTNWGERCLNAHYQALPVAHLLAAVLCTLLLPAFARANSVDLTFSNSGGTAGTSGLGVQGPFTLTNSNFTGLISGQNVSGLLSFSTGSSLTGSLAAGGSWASGGLFSLTETSGPVNGVIFYGSFASSVAWQLDTPGCTVSCEYTLSGAIAGYYYPAGQGSGQGIFVASGGTAQITILTNGPFAGGTFSFSGPGTTTLQVPVVTPEPGTVMFVATGLVGAVFAKRRRASS